MPRKVAAAPAAPTPAFDEGVSVQVTLTLPQCPHQRATKQGGGFRSTETKPVPPRIPRVARLMALAIKFQDMVDRSEVRDYAEIARLGYVTRARITQIMNLLLLAPDIQEALLFIQDSSGVASTTERDMRKLAKAAIWEDQRRLRAYHQD
jgi:hypothetical protein